MNRIPIQFLARQLNVRPKRVQEKVQKLGSPVHNGFMSISDAIQLVQSYVHNNKASVRTKEKALQLLEELKKGNVSMPKPSGQMPKKRCSKLRSNSCKTPVQRTSNKFLFGLKRTVVEVIQLGVQALESTQFKFVALMVAIGVQMQHSAFWYERIASDGKGNMYAAYGYAFMVDLFILVVTMEGKINIAKTFAVLTFFSNVLYFQFWIGFDGSAMAYTNAVSSILISGVIAYVIYGYTELFVKYRNEKFSE